MQTRLVDQVLSHIDVSKPSVVAVCGAADLGKSYLSQKILDELLMRGVSVGLLTLDSYLVERAERVRRGLSGYQIESYNQAGLIDALNSFKDQKSIDYFPYDHTMGKACGDQVTIAPCSVLIVDGLHSLHENVYGLIDFSIFIYTDDESLKKIRFDADLTKRGLTVEQANSHSESEFLLYKSMIDPYKSKADLRLYLVEKWRYLLD